MAPRTFKITENGPWLKKSLAIPGLDINFVEVRPNKIVASFKFIQIYSNSMIGIESWEVIERAGLHQDSWQARLP